MQKTLDEIARLVGGKVIGDPGFFVTGVNGIKEAAEGEITFVDNSKYFPLVNTTAASAIITPRAIETSKHLIVAEHPSYAFARTASLFLEEENFHPTGIHETALIDSSAKIGDQVGIGPYTVIGPEAEIGDHAIIHGHCFIGARASVGEASLIYPMVTIREKVKIQRRVIIHPGAVLGADGFGFVNVQGEHKKIPQLGTVIIEDDVEIGANVTIDRARFGATVIGHGTKIDNLVHVAHNVRIGSDCIIIAQVGISGSVDIGKNVILAGQVGVTGHLSIGDGTVVASQSGVTKSLPPGITVLGFPARPERAVKRVIACTQRLPQYFDLVKQLSERVQKLEEALAKKEKPKK